MAPWGFLATTAVCTVFPSQRGVILTVSAVVSLVRGGRRRLARLAQQQEEEEAEGSSLQPSSGGKGVSFEWGRIDCKLLDKKTGKVVSPPPSLRDRSPRRTLFDAQAAPLRRMIDKVRESPALANLDFCSRLPPALLRRFFPAPCGMHCAVDWWSAMHCHAPVLWCRARSC